MSFWDDEGLDDLPLDLVEWRIRQLVTREIDAALTRDRMEYMERRGKMPPAVRRKEDEE